MKIHPGEPSCSAVMKGWTDREDIMKQTAAFCTSADVHKSFDYMALWKLDTTANLTGTKRGACPLVTCTQFSDHSSSQSSSDWLTWQHTICHCICSPLLRYPIENAHYVRHGITVNWKGIHV